MCENDYFDVGIVIVGFKTSDRNGELKNTF